MPGEITHLSRRKASNTQQTCSYRHTRKTSGLFYDTVRVATLPPRNKFANLGSFAKVSVPVESMIPWTEILPDLELPPTLLSLSLSAFFLPDLQHS